MFNTLPAMVGMCAADLDALLQNPLVVEILHPSFNRETTKGGRFRKDLESGRPGC